MDEYEATMNDVDLSRTVRFKKIRPSAIIPKRQTDGAAGFDIYSNETCVVEHGETTLVKTGVAVAIPPGYVGLIKPRSGWALKYGIDTMAGVIDSDYRGEVHVMLTRHTDIDEPHLSVAGERIAQMIVVPVVLASIEVDELDDTDRGAGGYGSTGVK